MTCTETNAAGTTSDPTTYYMNIDQQTPMVAYSQPPGDTGGQGNASSASASMSPAALAAKTGLPEREFGLAPLTSKVAASSSDPVPATGHLAPAGPAEFRLSPHASTTGVQYSDTATQVNATPSELSDLSGVYGEYCSDTNQTEPGSGGNVSRSHTDDGAVLGSGGTAATLDVPDPANANDAVTGIHLVDCYGKDLSTFTGSDAARAVLRRWRRRHPLPVCLQPDAVRLHRQRRRCEPGDYRLGDHQPGGDGHRPRSVHLRPWPLVSG